MGVKQCKPPGGSESMLSKEILKLKSSEIGGNVHFSIHFWICKVFKEGNQVTRKSGTLPDSLKSGGYVSPVPPVQTSMVQGLNIRYLNKKSIFFARASIYM